MILNREKSILFVCRGNTCRSPLAAAICQKNLEERGQLSQWRIDSCGIKVAKEGQPPAVEGKG